MNSYDETFEYSLNPCLFETKNIGGRNFRVNTLNNKYYNKFESNLNNIQKQLDKFDKSSSDEDSYSSEEEIDIPDNIVEDEDSYNNKFNKISKIEEEFTDNKSNSNTNYDFKTNSNLIQNNKSKVELKVNNTSYNPKYNRGSDVKVQLIEKDKLIDNKIKQDNEIIKNKNIDKTNEVESNNKVTTSEINKLNPNENKIINENGIKSEKEKNENFKKLENNNFEINDKNKENDILISEIAFKKKISEKNNDLNNKFSSIFNQYLDNIEYSKEKYYKLVMPISKEIINISEFKKEILNHFQLDNEILDKFECKIKIGKNEYFFIEILTIFNNYTADEENKYLKVFERLKDFKYEKKKDLEIKIDSIEVADLTNNDWNIPENYWLENEESLKFNTKTIFMKDKNIFKNESLIGFIDEVLQFLMSSEICSLEQILNDQNVVFDKLSDSFELKNIGINLISFSLFRLIKSSEHLKFLKNQNDNSKLSTQNNDLKKLIIDGFNGDKLIKKLKHVKNIYKDLNLSSFAVIDQDNNIVHQITL